MARRRWRALAWLTVTALSGCSGGGGGATGGNPVPPPPDSGLDAQPDNLSCIAPDRPSTPDVAVAWTRVFPALVFADPVLAVEAPSDSERWFVVEQTGRVRVFENL